MTARLTGGLHRRHARERLRPGSGEHQRVVVHLVTAVTGLPDVALFEIVEPSSSSGRRTTTCRVGSKAHRRADWASRP